MQLCKLSCLRSACKNRLYKCITSKRQRKLYHAISNFPSEKNVLYELITSLSSPSAHVYLYTTGSRKHRSLQIFSSFTKGQIFKSKKDRSSSRHRNQNATQALLSCSSSATVDWERKIVREEESSRKEGEVKDGTVRCGTVGVRTSTIIANLSCSTISPSKLFRQLCVSQPLRLAPSLPSRACGPCKVIKFGEIALKKNQRRSSQCTGLL